MGKNLVIVESPAKAKTINKYLGNDYIVKSSVGHIRDLPKSSPDKAKKKPAKRVSTAGMTAKQKEAHRKKKSETDLIRKMGIDPNHGWKARYEILSDKVKVVDDLKQKAANADTIYLATDLDREGEAIAWHLMEAIGGDKSKYKRVVFNEITEKAIQEAFKKPGELDQDRVDAQQARRFLDRVVGFSLSPLLWKKIARSLSAGRVQSVAVKLLVERELEIHAFIAEEYWRIYADLKTGATTDFRVEVKKENGKAFKPVNKDQADAALAKLNPAQYVVSSREEKPTSSKPYPPFITSTLQQAASTRLGYGVKKTMVLAQRLYEAGHITYMRTDSTNLSGEAVSAARKLIGEDHGSEYLPKSPRMYSSKEGAQEAHEAIRPSNVKGYPGTLTGLEKDAERLYELIWRQFIACQMENATFDSTSLVIDADVYQLTTSGRIMRFDGHLKVLPSMGKSATDQILPDVKVGDVLELIELEPNQHFTKPPARFSEARLVKELEARGIGRPSTYSSIISTIQDRGYVTLKNKRFYAEKIAEIVTSRLSESFPLLMSYDFTASLEDQLDKVADGSLNWKAFLDEYYKDFKAKLVKANGEEGGMRTNDPVTIDIKCPDCDRPMVIRTGATGVFLGCSGYSLPPKERCKKTMPLTAGDEATNADSEDAESEIHRHDRRCKTCNHFSMDSFLVDETRKLHVCANIPDCEGTEVEEGNFVIKGYDGPKLECDRCQSDMELKDGRFGKYFDCTNADCKNTRKLLKSGEPAPPKADPVPMPELACLKCDDYYLLRDGASGIFLAASKFPKNRETRPPKVAEILPHKEELDPKFLYLTEAPVKDNKGNLTQIRYSRKAKEQYVMTENKQGKATGWSAKYRDGAWVVELPKKKAAKKASKKKTTAEK